ncbi:hypothetical protein TrLO_g4910 [Triparma laevis f. longispina]|uniref:Small-subunit processome Utp12 domain-containing protein n=1 Tax=Triparma laevis f. longispina TaxID=1714387 RepID=A0A9W7F347_9STRA|nr:hypothetical protein TrLO_g4910 [Triparma laevis f. longispina]
MHRTHLRYECADTFGTCHSSPSTLSNTSVVLFPQSSSSSKSSQKSSQQSPLVLVPALSNLNLHDLRTGTIKTKLGHRYDSQFGTQKALNAGEATYAALYEEEEGEGEEARKHMVASGWTDGSVRVFMVDKEDLKTNDPPVNSLLDQNSTTPNYKNTEAPLTLTGHTGPITCLSFDTKNKRLSSGGVDGACVIWDVISESGLFRLTGHKAAVTNLKFYSPDVEHDYLISSSLDGHIKIWDLKAQHCLQTIVGHRSEVWSFDTTTSLDPTTNLPRHRLTSGASDNFLRSWSLSPPQENTDEVAKFLGSISRTSQEKSGVIKYHRNAGFMAAGYHASRDVEVYCFRSGEESKKRMKRRLRRRREKDGKVKVSKTVKGVLEDSSSDEEGEETTNDDDDNSEYDPNSIKTVDELTLSCLLRASAKVKGFEFLRNLEKGGGARIVVALATNAMEVHSVGKYVEGIDTPQSKKLNTLDMYGHSSPIRSLSISPDDTLACSVSKGSFKIWNVESRTCLRALPLTKNKQTLYGLCSAFVPETMLVVLGTKEGNLILVDYASGNVVSVQENAHEGAIWSLDVTKKYDEETGETIVLVMTGSADHMVKIWEVEEEGDDLSDEDEEEDEDEEKNSGPTLVHTQTLKMSDDVVSVKFSYAPETSKLLVFVSSLDSTVKVYFQDSLKFFLSLYGHKLPALALDCADDDTILASGGADKTLKIWGLDFGDCHRSMHGHTEAITGIKFVRKTHNFFSSSKDKSLRYWDADRFEQILLLDGHVSEVYSLAISKSGGFVLSAGMDRQVRVWERTHDMVFIEEEKEVALEKMYDKIHGARGEAKIGSKADDGEGMDDEEGDDGFGKSEAAVKKSVLSVAAGDRIFEAIDLADSETQEIVAVNSTNRARKARGEPEISVRSNPLMMNMDPPKYILWVLKTIKVADLEQALLILPVIKVERLIHYMVALLRQNAGVELCGKVAIFLIKTHKSQILSNHSMAGALKDLRNLLKLKLTKQRDALGYNLVAMKAVTRAAQERRNAKSDMREEVSAEDIWGNLGLGALSQPGAEDANALKAKKRQRA